MPLSRESAGANPNAPNQDQMQGKDGDAEIDGTKSTQFGDDKAKGSKKGTATYLFDNGLRECLAHDWRISVSVRSVESSRSHDEGERRMEVSERASESGKCEREEEEIGRRRGWRGGASIEGKRST